MVPGILIGAVWCCVAERMFPGILIGAECGALLLGGWFLAFLRIIVPSSSGVISP